MMRFSKVNDPEYTPPVDRIPWKLSDDRPDKYIYKDGYLFKSQKEANDFVFPETRPEAK